MKQCQERQAPDVMRLVLDERREAGGLGTLAADGHAYASTLACFGKVIIALDITPYQITLVRVVIVASRVVYLRVKWTIFVTSFRLGASVFGAACSAATGCCCCVFSWVKAVGCEQKQGGRERYTSVLSSVATCATPHSFLALYGMLDIVFLGLDLVCISCIFLVFVRQSVCRRLWSFLGRCWKPG